MKKEWIDAMQNWLVTNGPDFLVNLVVFLLILLVGHFIIKAILGVLRPTLHKSKRFNQMLENFIIALLQKILWLILIMMALPQLGINPAPLIAGLGVGGFIIGFAFQETLGNLAAGMMLLVNQPYAGGDFVEVGGITGKVADMNLMATTLNTPDNKRVIIPNRKIWGAEIINYTANPNRRVDLKISISYKADISKALSVAERVLSEHSQVLKDPAPIIGVVELADSSVNLVVRPWVNTADYWTVYFDVTKKLKESFDREGVAIPFPQLDVHVKEFPKS